jgi:TolA-binding protein
VYRFGAALDDFKKVSEEFPDADLAEDASYMIGLCYYARRKDTLALSSFLSFITRYPESKLKPEAIFWVGEFQYNRGQYEMAEQAFLLLADSYPAHRLGAEALFRAGRAAAGRKNYVRSIEILGRMIKKYPQSPRVAEARFSQADALSELGRFSEAILVFDEIINQHAGTDLVWPAWGRKGDCQFMLGQEDPKRYEESLASYRVVASQSASSRDLVLQAEYKIGRCYAKLGHMDEALEQYYTKVINRYFEETAKGVWHNEASKVWFTRAARDAADILEARKDWRGAVSLLGKIVDAGMPASEEAKERSERIRTERGWLFH